MFLHSQPKNQSQQYQHYLQIAGSLSNLFSDSSAPYLYYRLAEKLFCKAFNADDLSRSDVSADAKKEGVGVGMKTFLAGNRKSFQKVAEFNRDRHLYMNLKPSKMIDKIAELRNSRLQFTANVHGLSNSCYHCIIRDKGKFMIFEEPMDLIDVSKIKISKENKSSIVFEDGKNDYSFLLSKSTLTKRFVTKTIVSEFEVKILKNPFDELEKLFSKDNLLFESEKIIKQTVFLPLYGRNKTVFERSGLNQWNAKGRPRHHNEAYIPIPANLHKTYPDFFPSRETSFNLKLPDGKIMRSKVCQAGGKALMSYSNRELGEWILRKVLNLKKGELLTYKKLQKIGIDSARIDKTNESKFEINFASLGRFEKFKQNHLDEK